MELNRKQASLLFLASIIGMLFPTYAWLGLIKARSDVPGDQSISDQKYLQFFFDVFDSVKTIIIVSITLSLISLVCVIVYRQAVVQKGWLSRIVRNAAILFSLLYLALWISRAY